MSLRCDKDTDDGLHDRTSTTTTTAAPRSRDCKDTNPGTYPRALTNYLGIMQGQAFVEDRTCDDEVWNQPLRGYHITGKQEVTARRGQPS